MVNGMVHGNQASGQATRGENDKSDPFPRVALVRNL